MTRPLDWVQMNDSTQTQRKVARVQELIRAGESQREACRHAGIPHPTYRYHAKKQGLPGPAPSNPVSVETAGADDKSASSGTLPTAITEEELLRKHGIDPDDVVIQSGRATEWGQADSPNHHLRVNYERKDSMYILPDPAGWTPPPKPDGWDRDDYATIGGTSFAFLTDQHLPYINRPLERAVLRYCEEECPGLIVVGGDLGDYGVLSSHRSHPRYKAMVSHTHDEITAFLWRLRVKNPDAKIVVLQGNHDARLPNLFEDKVPELVGLRPGALPTDEEEPGCVYGFRQLWRLDELGIQLVDEDWKLGKFPIAQELTARHGHFTGASSEKKGMEKYGRSQLHGHTHTAQMLYRTKHDPLDIRVSVSSPVMAQVEEDGLGYEPEPDWTPGITTGYVWEDGDFVLNIAPFINNHLLLPSGWRISGEEDSE